MLERAGTFRWNNHSCAVGVAPEGLRESLHSAIRTDRLVLITRAYDRRKLMDKAAFKDFVIEIVRRIDSDPGFKVLPRRWVVERTFGWMTRWRRLVRDYEQRIDVSKAMIHVALGSLLLRRITH